MNNDQIETIEMTAESAKQDLELSRKLDTLINNKEFDEIITKGFFENEAIRLAQLTGEPGLQSEEDQKDLMSRIRAIGYLRQYFLFIRRKGHMAERALVDCERELEIARNEENH